MKLSSACLFLLFALVYPHSSLCDSDQRLSVSCCDLSGYFRLNLIPHPTSCLVFHQCEPALLSDGRYGTVPTLKYCPLDEDGRPQHYDFRECRCLRDHEASCFDATIRENMEAFFNCTQPFTVEGSKVRCK